MSGGAHLCGLTPGQRSSEETSQRWRAVVGTGSDLKGLRFEPRTPRTHSNVLTTGLMAEFVAKLMYYGSSFRLLAPQEHYKRIKNSEKKMK